MIACRKTLRLLSVKREWSQDDRLKAEKHLAYCPKCRSVAREYELMDRRIVRLASHAIPSSLDSLDRLPFADCASLTRSRRLGADVAISLLALLVIGAAIFGLGIADSAVSWRRLATTAQRVGYELATLGPELLGGSVLAPAESPEFTFPVAGMLTQGFWRQHKAIDIACERGTPVTAAAKGRVAEIGREPDGYGLMIVLEHGDGWETLYAHLDTSLVQVGKEVVPGQVIGQVGNTGLSTGPHLHLEVCHRGACVDPLTVIPREAWQHQLYIVAAPSMDWPVAGSVTQGFSGEHHAIDIAAELGTEVRAVADGTVVRVGENGRQGRYLVLDHGSGYSSVYTHLATRDVLLGQDVSQNQAIGTVGRTGISTGPHLHLEIRLHDIALNPLEFLP